MTNTWDTANRLINSTNSTNSLTPIYNGVGDRVGQTVESTTTDFALDIAAGLPEVIYTSQSEIYLHLPGVIVAEKASEVRYLLSDGLGSIRQATDDSGAVVAYNEFDPYGSPIVNRQSEIENPYGFTGEWWQADVALLHLRARWYAPETGTFLSVDPVESEPPYQYVRGNVVNLTDSSGKSPNCYRGNCGPDITTWLRTEIAFHVAYGQIVKTVYDDMWRQMITGNIGSDPSVLRHNKLKNLKTATPFTEILDAYSHFGLGEKGGLINLQKLALIELGVYGLAVDYADTDFYNRRVA